MDIRFDSCSRKSANFSKNVSRTEVDGSRRKAWAFTRLSIICVWRRFENVDEVTSPRSFFVLNRNNNHN